MGSGATARRWTPPALLNLLLDVPRSYKRRLKVEKPRKNKSNTPPALLNLLLEVPRSYKRRLEVEQPRKAKSNTRPALLNLQDLAS